MKHNRVRKAVTGVVCVICLFCVAVACAGILILTYSLSGSGQGNGLNLFGYTIFLVDPNSPSGDYPPGDAIIARDVPHEDLEPGDYIVCRDLDVDNQFYPVLRIVFAYDSSRPLTVTVETIGEGQILTVNRDDVIGKCVFSSAFLGKALRFLQNQERGTGLLAVTLGAMAALFTACLLFYLFLGQRAKKKNALFLPPDEPVDLLEIVEQEDVTLEFIERPGPVEDLDETKDQETIPTEDITEPSKAEQVKSEKDAEASTGGQKETTLS